MNDERIKHLEFIHNTIGRQASHSFAAKGWSVTVSTAAYLYVLREPCICLALLSVLPSVVFAAMDAYYLRNERGFRRLYDDVAAQNPGIPAFSMDITDYFTTPGKPSCEWTDILRSNAWWWMHVPIVGVGFALLLSTLIRSIFF